MARMWRARMTSRRARSMATVGWDLEERGASDEGAMLLLGLDRDRRFAMCSLSALGGVEINADARWCISLPVTGACGGDSCGVVTRFVFWNNPVLSIFERGLLRAADAITDVRKARPVINADEDADAEAGCACNCDGNNECSHLIAALLSSRTPWRWEVGAGGAYRVSRAIGYTRVRGVDS